MTVALGAIAVSGLGSMAQKLTAPQWWVRSRLPGAVGSGLWLEAEGARPPQREVGRLRAPRPVLTVPPSAQGGAVPRHAAVAEGLIRASGPFLQL